MEIGGDEFVVMAGPCSVESEKQIMQAAEGVAQSGAKMLRGGAFKPRTSPYDFQGMEEEGLKLLQKAQEATGLGDHHRSDERPRRGADRAVRGRDASRRAEYAELRAAEGAGEMRAAGAAEARDERDDQGVVDVGGIYRGAWESERDFVRARDSDV